MSNSNYNKLVKEFNSLQYIKNIKNKNTLIYNLSKDDYISIFNEILFVKYEKEYENKKSSIQKKTLSDIFSENGIVNIINQYTKDNPYDNVIFELKDILHNIKYMDCEYVLNNYPYRLISHLSNLDSNNEEYVYEEYDDYHYY